MKCPSCNTDLESLPTSCPGCARAVAAAADGEGAVTGPKARAVLLGFNRGQWKETSGQLADQFGQEPSDADVLWALCNQETVSAGVAGDLPRVARVRASMQDQVWLRGRLDNSHVQLRAEAELAAADGPKVQLVAGRPSPNPRCQAADGKVVDLSEQPLPHEGEEPCRCTLQQADSGSGLFARAKRWVSDAASEMTQATEKKADSTEENRTRSRTNRANEAYEREVRRIKSEARSTFDGSGPEDQHFRDMHLMKQLYKLRNEHDQALEDVERIALRMVERAPKVAAAMRRTYGSDQPLPQNPAVSRLAILWERRGEYDRAIELVEQARDAGWSGDHEKRLERLKRRATD